MIKKVFILLSSFFINNSNFSQNLIPNPSFEDTVVCPAGYGQIYYSKYWFRPTLQLGVGTSDYYHSCANFSSPSIGVPSNVVGYQSAKLGIAYAGFAVYTTDFGGELREYIEVSLQDSLVKNKIYCLEFYVSLAEGPMATTHGAIKEIGAYFSLDSVLNSGWEHIAVIPQVENNSFITDASGWTLISGQFIAQGGEKFITIGNFRSDANTSVWDLDTVPCANGNFCTIYYYIDDVSVYCCDNANTQIELGNNITICEGDSVAIGQLQTTGYYYRWSLANGLNDDDTSIAQPIVKPTITTTYYLFVEDTAKKQSCNNTTTDSITLFVIAPATADAGTDTTICEGESTVIGNGATASGYNYNWQPVTNLSDATIVQPTASPTQTTEYVLTVNDTGNLCTPARDTTTVSVEDCDTVKPNSVYIPNIFSPNGDGNNDYFKVHGANIVEGELTIYNRWAERIWDLGFGIWDFKDETKWWDGTYKGKPLNTGVFVYFCRVIYKDGASEEKKGNVTLVR